MARKGALPGSCIIRKPAGRCHLRRYRSYASEARINVSEVARLAEGTVFQIAKEKNTPSLCCRTDVWKGEEIPDFLIRRSAREDAWFSTMRVDSEAWPRYVRKVKDGGLRRASTLKMQCPEHLLPPKSLHRKLPTSPDPARAAAYSKDEIPLTSKPDLFGSALAAREAARILFGNRRGVSRECAMLVGSSAGRIFSPIRNLDAAIDQLIRCQAHAASGCEDAASGHRLQSIRSTREDSERMRLTRAGDQPR